LKCVILISE